MMSVALPMIMDALIILLLAGTIFYAARLSFHIKAFRNNKTELEKLLQTLASQIDQAERAVEGLRENARKTGRDLQDTINEAQGMSEELQIISQSGDRLAGRLEKLLEKSPRASDLKSRSAQNLERAEARMPGRGQSERLQRPQYPPKPPPQPEQNVPAPFAGFAIRDPEFDREDDDMMDEDGLMAGDYEEEAEESFNSQAEKDLYEALQNKKKTKAGAGGV